MHSKGKLEKEGRDGQPNLDTVVYLASALLPCERIPDGGRRAGPPRSPPPSLSSHVRLLWESLSLFILGETLGNVDKVDLPEVRMRGGDNGRRAQ